MIEKQCNIFDINIHLVIFTNYVTRDFIFCPEYSVEKQSFLKIRIILGNVASKSRKEKKMKKRIVRSLKGKKTTKCKSILFLYILELRQIES